MFSDDAPFYRERINDIRRATTKLEFALMVPTENEQPELHMGHLKDALEAIVERFQGIS